MADGLGIGRIGSGLSAGAKPIFNGRCIVAGLGRVVGQQFGLGLQQMRKAVLERVVDLRVKRNAAVLEEGLVGNVPYQGVLEHVYGVRRHPSAPQAPKPAPGVTTTCASSSSRSKNSHEPVPAGVRAQTYGAFTPPNTSSPSSPSPSRTSFALWR